MTQNLPIVFETAAYTCLPPHAISWHVLLCLPFNSLTSQFENLWFKTITVS